MVSKKMTLYKNGAVIDDDVNTFISYDTPEGKKLVEELGKGVVPTIMRKQYPSGVDLGLEDKRYAILKLITEAKT